MKKQDKLEKFVRENRAAFDHLEADDALWNSISAGIAQPDQGKKTTTNWNWVWKIAASLLLILSIGLLFERQQQTANYPIATSNEEAETGAELNQVEAYYTGIIEESQSQLHEYLKQYPELAESFGQDIQSLDSTYQQLKIQYTQNKNDQKVKDAMILNLQLRIEVLNRQLSILQQVKKVTNHDNINI